MNNLTGGDAHPPGAPFGPAGGAPPSGSPGMGSVPGGPAGPRTDVLAIVALVGGLLAVMGAILNLVTGFVAMCCPLCTMGGAVIGAVVAVPAITGIVTGALGYRRTTQQPEVYTGKGLAITGVITGVIALLMTIATVVAPWLGWGCIGATAPDPPANQGVYDPVPATDPVFPAAPDPAPVEPEPAHAINDTFRVGEFSYRVTEVEVTNRVGRNRFLRERSSPGAVFLVVRYSETNEGSETHTGAGAPIRFRDGQGRMYQPSSRASTALAMAERNELLPQLQPGIAHQASTAFEIPDDSATGVGTLIVQERGLLGTRTAEVEFQIPGQ